MTRHIVMLACGMLLSCWACHIRAAEPAAPAAVSKEEARALFEKVRHTQADLKTLRKETENVESQISQKETELENYRQVTERNERIIQRLTEQAKAVPPAAHK